MIEKNTLIELLKEQKMPEDIILMYEKKKLGVLLIRGNYTKIKAIIKILKPYFDLGILNLQKLMRSSSILVNGNPDEIEKIINVIKSENKIGTEIINCCPSILAQGKASTIKAIIELFKKEKLDINLIYSCPYILAQGTEKSIKIVIKELKLHDINFEKLYKTPLTKIFLQPDFTSMLCNPYSSNYNKNDYFLALKSYLILKNKCPDYYTK